MAYREGAQPGGIEYAIRRDEDGAYFFDADLDGRDTSWEFDAENAVWFENKDQLKGCAIINGLAGDDDGLRDGLKIVSREWYYEEDLIPDEDDDDPYW